MIIFIIMLILGYMLGRRIIELKRDKEFNEFLLEQHIKRSHQLRLTQLWQNKQQDAY